MVWTLLLLLTVAWLLSLLAGAELLKLLEEEEISGVPVVGPDETVLGVVPLSDVARAAGDEARFVDRAGVHRALGRTAPSWRASSRSWTSRGRWPERATRHEVRVATLNPGYAIHDRLNGELTPCPLDPPYVCRPRS